MEINGFIVLTIALTKNNKNCCIVVMVQLPVVQLLYVFRTQTISSASNIEKCFNLTFPKIIQRMGCVMSGSIMLRQKRKSGAESNCESAKLKKCEPY